MRDVAILVVPIVALVLIGWLLVERQARRDRRRRRRRGGYFGDRR